MGAAWSDSNEDYAASLDPFDHLKTVKDLDFAKFSGTWWVMAHHPNQWEEGCQRSTREVTYDAINDKLSIKNKCWREGKISKEIDQAMSVPDPTDKGKMYGTFIQENEDHRLWVHATDYDNYAIVGDPEHHKVWIWTRQEKIDNKTIPKFMDMVADYGYDPRFLMVDSKNTVVL